MSSSVTEPAPRSNPDPGIVRMAWPDGCCFSESRHALWPVRASIEAALVELDRIRDSIDAAPESCFDPAKFTEADGEFISSTEDALYELQAGLGSTADLLTAQVEEWGRMRTVIGHRAELDLAREA